MWGALSQAMEAPPIDNSCLFTLVQRSDKIPGDQKLGLGSMARTYREIFSAIRPTGCRTLSEYHTQLWYNYRTTVIPKLTDYVALNLSIFRCAAKEFYADNISLRELISLRVTDLEEKWNKPMTCLDYLRVAICLSCLTEPRIPSYIIESMEMVLSPDLNVALVPIPVHTGNPTFNGLFGEAAILCAMLNGFMPIMFTLDPAVTAHEGLVQGPAYGIDHDLFHFIQLSKITLPIQSLLLSSPWHQVFQLMNSVDGINRFYQFLHEDVMQKLAPDSMCELTFKLFCYVAEYILGQDFSDMQTRLPNFLNLMIRNNEICDSDEIYSYFYYRIDQSPLLRFALKHNCFKDIRRVYLDIMQDAPFNEILALAILMISMKEKQGYSDELFCLTYRRQELEAFRRTLIFMRDEHSLDERKYTHGYHHFMDLVEGGYD